MLFYQLDQMTIFEEIFSWTLKGREKVEDCNFVFLDCICNHCNFIGFNWKNSEFEVFANFPNIKREID